MNSNFLSEIENSEMWLGATTIRRGPAIYANVLICDSGKGFWYDSLDGLEALCKLRISVWNGKKYLRDLEIVRLSNTKIEIGRSISPKDIILL